MAGKESYGLQVPDVWNAKEKQVFRELEIGEGDVSLRRLIRGQRMINGKLYDALDLIVKHLKQQPAGKNKAGAALLKKAEKLVDAIPAEDPPRCQSGGGVGGP